MRTFTRVANMSPGLRDTGDEIDAEHINVLQESVEDLQNGALPIALAGIEEALGEYEPLQHVAPDSPPTRSQSLRGRGTTPAWSPSEVILLEDFGGAGNNSYDNSYVIPSAIDEAAAQGTSARTGAPIQLLRGTYLISQPIVLPRSGVTPTNVVHLLGSNIRSTVLAGTNNFPTGRGMIEWEAATARAWHQRIGNMAIRCPNVAGTMAIWYKRNGSRPATSYDDYTNERLQINLHDLLIEGSNRYHEVFIQLEGSVFSSSFIRIWGDPSLTNIGFVGDGYSTLLLRGDVGYNASQADAPLSPNDSPGFFACEFNDLRDMFRRGGYGRVFEGRLVRSRFVLGFGNGGNAGAITYHFVNSVNSEIGVISTEGQSDTSIRVTRGHLVHLHNIGLGVPDPVYPGWQATHTYGAGEQVVPTWARGANQATQDVYSYVSSGGTSGSSQPTWPTGEGSTVSDGSVTWTRSERLALGNGIEFVGCADCTLENRLASGNMISHAHRLKKSLVIDADSLRIRVKKFLVRKRSGGSITDDYSDAGTDSDLEVLEATTIGSVAGVD